MKREKPCYVLILAKKILLGLYAMLLQASTLHIYGVQIPN